MPTVVDGDVAEELDVAGLGVDLDDGDVRADGPARSSAGRRRTSPRAPARCRPAGCAPSTPRTRAPSRRQSSVPVRRVNVPSSYSSSSSVDLELVRGDLARLLDDPLRRVVRARRRRRRGCGCRTCPSRAARPPCRRAAPPRRRRRSPSRSATICDERRLVALPVRRRAGQHLHRSGRQDSGSSPRPSRPPP